MYEDILAQIDENLENCFSDDIDDYLTEEDLEELNKPIR